MDLVNLWNAVYARIKADTGAGGLWQGGSPTLITAAFNSDAARDAVFPYVVFDVASYTSEDTFAADMKEVSIRFSVYAEKFPNTTGATMTTGAQILARLYGNAVSQAARVPTYGFHRWLPTLSGSWVASQMMQTGQFEAHEDGIYHWIDEYRVFATLG